jgi:hypothetical protein
MPAGHNESPRACTVTLSASRPSVLSKHQFNPCPPGGPRAVPCCQRQPDGNLPAGWPVCGARYVRPRPGRIDARALPITILWSMIMLRVVATEMNPAVVHQRYHRCSGCARTGWHAAITYVRSYKWQLELCAMGVGGSVGGGCCGGDSFFSRKRTAVRPYPEE